MRIGKLIIIGAVALSLGGCADGYKKQSSIDGIDDMDVASRGASSGKRFKGKDSREWQERALMAKRTYYFGFDQDSLSAEDKLALDAHAQFMISHPSAKLRVEGHTDERGSREYNIGLGERRAKAVYNYLLSKNAPEDRVAVVSYGKEKPADPRHEEIAWDRNRRANIVYEAT